MTANNQIAEASVKYLAEATGQVVPVGYKRTEVGVIPKEWSVSEIENLNLKNFPAVKAGPFGSALTKEVYVKTGYKIYGQEQVIKADHEYGDYFIDEVKFRQLKSCEVTDGDILLSLVGTAGKLLVIPPNAQKGIINPRLLRFRFDKTKVNSDYFRYFFESDYIQNYLSSAAQGGTMAVLNAGMLKSLQIPLPKIKEQTAIANALSDVDALINELEKLIVKKQAIKTATMQQLLTGRTRLPQFALREDGTQKGYKQSELGDIPEDWDAIKMGDLAKIQRGASPRPIDNPIWFDRNSSVGWLRISDVSRTSKYLAETTQSLSDLGIENSRFVPANSLVMSICATVGKPIITHVDLCIHDGFVVFNGLSTDYDYMYYVLKDLEDEWGKQGQTGSQMNLNTDLINNTYVAIPADKEEQTAIATILSDMDADIQTLQQRLSKTRQIKQGMMQKLLTGKTRLI